MPIAAGLLLALLAGDVQAHEPVDEAARLLSRYPAGQLPADPLVLQAVQQLRAAGGRDEISLLRNLVQHESGEVQHEAAEAIAAIRSRQRAGQRVAFAGSLPDDRALRAAAHAWQAEGLGHEEALCAAYATSVLGERADALPGAGDGDAHELLAEGRPRRALAAALADDGPEARLVEARALEDLGEVRGAVRRYALLAARGDQDASRSLDAFGIDLERLLLGMLALPQAADEGVLLEALVRHGDALTVQVLTERSLRSDPAAARALARLLDPGSRELHLEPALRSAAQQALTSVAMDAPVDEGLKVRRDP